MLTNTALVTVGFTRARTNYQLVLLRIVPVSQNAAHHPSPTHRPTYLFVCQPIPFLTDLITISKTAWTMEQMYKGKATIMAGPQRNLHGRYANMFMCRPIHNLAMCIAISNTAPTTAKMPKGQPATMTRLQCHLLHGLKQVQPNLASHLKKSQERGGGGREGGREGREGRNAIISRGLGALLAWKRT